VTDEPLASRATADRSGAFAVRLRLSTGGAEHVLGADRPLLRFGRADDNDVRMGDEFASRHHGSIVYRNGKFLLHDDSRNGTVILLAGARSVYAHQERIALEREGEIRIGHLEGEAMRFVVETRPPDSDTWTLADMRAAFAEAAPRTNAFRREGEYWTLAYGGNVLRLRDAKGLRYLAHLVRHPGQEFHVLDLILTLTDEDTAEAAGVKRRTGRALPASSAGPVLDVQAKAEYRRRLAALREQLEEAEGFNDVGRAEAARAEMDALATQLAQAVGLGGRDREAASDAERARVTVTLRVKAVLEKIRRGHPSLGHHLTTCVHTGRFCSYAPDPANPVGWDG
jgi:predicted component of type VI protein secretion system